MTKHTNEKLVFTWGAIETATGVSIARMDRGEVRTSPTERDANAKRLVQIWNLWPDVVAMLNDFVHYQPHFYLKDAGIAATLNMLERIREEMP